MKLGDGVEEELEQSLHLLDQRCAVGVFGGHPTFLLAPGRRRARRIPGCAVDTSSEPPLLPW